MTHYDFPTHFRALYSKAVSLQARGDATVEGLFTEAEKAFLAANGITPQNMYDYAEDHNEYGGEPGPDHALAIELVRRDYFLNVQGGIPSTVILDPALLPDKTDAVRGVAWLPRLLPKTRAKLRGELPPSLMFCCGGDRRFFKEHNILPAEFLALVWRHGDNREAVVDWVLHRRAGNPR